MITAIDIGMKIYIKDESSNLYDRIPRSQGLVRLKLISHNVRKGHEYPYKGIHGINVHRPWENANGNVS